MTIERIKDFISKKEEGILEIFEISPDENDDIKSLILEKGGIILSKKDIKFNLPKTLSEQKQKLGAISVYDFNTDSYKVKIVYKK